MQIKEALIHAAHTASQKIQAAAHTVSGVFCCHKTNAVVADAVVEAAPKRKMVITFTGPLPAFASEPFDLGSAHVAEVLTSQAKRHSASTPQAKALADNLQWSLLQIPQDGDESPSLHDRMVALRRAQLNIPDHIASLEENLVEEINAGTLETRKV